MKRQYIMPAMQDLDVTLKNVIMGSGELLEGSPDDVGQEMPAPSRLYR